MIRFCCPECGTPWTSRSDSLYCCNDYWRRRLGQDSTLPTDHTVGGDDAGTVVTTRSRVIGNGSVAAAAGGIDSPPAPSLRGAQ